MNYSFVSWNKDSGANFLQDSFLAHDRVFQDPGTQRPDTKLKPANWGPSWSLGRDLLSDQASVVRAGIRSSQGSPEKPQFAHLFSGQISLSAISGIQEANIEKWSCGY